MNNYLNTNKVKTIKRRSLQPIFNTFNINIKPYLMNGIILAISGGSDSRLLLESIIQWPNNILDKLIIVFCNHKTKNTSYNEGNIVIARAKTLGFKSKIINLPNINNKNESNLRILRYKQLWRLAKKYNIQSICTAHHANDSAEGYLLNLFGYGGGISGSGLVNKIYMYKLTLLRPFAHIYKKTLLLSLNATNIINYFQDKLDIQQISKRAQIRYNIIPKLKKYYHHIIKRLFILSQKTYNNERALLHITKNILNISIKNITIIKLYFKKHTKAIIKIILKHILSLLLHKKDLRNTEKSINVIANIIYNNKNSLNFTKQKKKYCHIAYATIIIFKNQVIIKKKC